MTFKPMLAATLESLEDVKFPVYVSSKLDGIRCLIVDGVAVSRNLKPIPNKHIQKCLKGLPDGLDGELILVIEDHHDLADFNAVQSVVMSEEGEPNFEYVVFDIVEDLAFEQRINTLETVFDNYPNKDKNYVFSILQHNLVISLKDLKKWEKQYVDWGYEGIMIRNPYGFYKHGRSTLKEFALVKFKRFKDAEAYIIGFEELQHNENEQTKDALGHSKRSSAKAGYIPAATLGSLCMYDEEHDIEFNIGTGFTQEMRDEIWNNQKKYMGKDVTYTYQQMSKKGVPRFPVFKAFREAL